MMNLNQGDKIGTFIYEGQIKHGGMAIAWAENTKEQQLRAMKMSLTGFSDDRDEQNKIAIRGEADLLSQLNHLRIIRVNTIPRDELQKAGDKYYARAYQLDNEPWYFVMEYLAGANLAEHLKRVGPLTVSEATNIVGNICLGLYYLHSRNLSHNDVKSENVVFRQPIRVGEAIDPVLIDFGTAAGVKRRFEDAGTPYTMSPERLRVAHGLDAPEKSVLVDVRKAETWSVGVLLYQALSCKTPFAARNMRTLTSQVLNDVPATLRKYNPEIPGELNTFIVDYCLSKTPRYRPTIEEVLRFLRPYGSGVTAIKE
ncbi:serine/threonine protein kinase [Chloroflexota bacterium]